ncbi:MAG: calcium-binding protein [Geminicoccaceae bacterium]
MAVITGTSGNDQYPHELEGTERADQIRGLAGDDSLIGFGGDDLLDGGAGADELFGSAGFDIASYAGSKAGVQVLLYAGSGLFGDAAGDHLYGIEGVTGSAFADGLAGDDYRNVLRGGGGNDELSGYGGNDSLYGDGGNDSVDGYEGKDKLFGGAGNDVLDGGAGNDELRGGGGSDTVRFTESGVYSPGVVVNLSDGTAQGGALFGNDRLLEIENVAGTSGNDVIFGNGAANLLTGGAGCDRLTGFGGADRFVYESRYDSNGKAPDLIADFSRAQGDRIDLRAIDANEQVDGDQAFRFIGDHEFTAVGQLRAYAYNGHTVLEINTSDAISGGEMTVVVDPLVTLQGKDFLL